MKILKVVLSVILALVIIVVLGSYLLPKKSKVERSILISVPDSVVYAYVADFSKFNEWSPYYEMEPAAKVNITGNLAQVGSVYAWDGEKLGKGSFELMRLDPYHGIYEKLSFYTPMEAVADNNFFFEPQGKATKVTWSYEGENNGIIARWMGLAMDSMLGKDFSRGLEKMKANLEK